MNIIIVGGGRVGQRLTELLLPFGEIVVIETDKAQAEKLADAADVLVIVGDGGSLETLEEAGIAEADVLVGATGDDKTNLVVCELAKRYKIKRSVARIKEVKDEPVFEELGVSDAVLECDVVARVLAHSVFGLKDSELFNFINKLIPLKRKGEKLMWKLIKEDSPMLYKSIRDIKLPKGANILSLIRNYDLIIAEDKTLKEGDLILVIVEEQYISKIDRLFD